MFKTIFHFFASLSVFYLLWHFCNFFSAAWVMSRKFIQLNNEMIKSVSVLAFASYKEKHALICYFNDLAMTWKFITLFLFHGFLF